MAQITNKIATEIADIAKKTWFTRYPLAQRIVFDRGTDFMAKFAKMCQTTMASKGNQVQLGIFSPMLSSNESIKILEISSPYLTCTISLTTIHGLAF